jgi:hypothetical protein
VSAGEQITITRGANGIAIPQGQQGFVASHQGLAKPSRSAASAPERQAASNLPGTLAG